MTLADEIREAAAALDAGVLSACTVAKLAAIPEQVQRDLAILQAAALLDPAGKHSRWKRAKLLADRLSRFEATAWPRIKAGHRTPRDPLETALTRILSSRNPPLSQRRLFPILN